MSLHSGKISMSCLRIFQYLISSKTYFVMNFKKVRSEIKGHLNYSAHILSPQTYIISALYSRYRIVNYRLSYLIKCVVKCKHYFFVYFCLQFLQDMMISPYFQLNFLGTILNQIHFKQYLQLYLITFVVVVIRQIYSICY